MIKIFERNITILNSKYAIAEILWWVFFMILAFTYGRLHLEFNIIHFLLMMILYVIGMIFTSRYVTKVTNKDVTIEKIKLLDNPKFSEEERKEIILNLVVGYLPQSVVKEIDKVLNHGSEQNG